VQRILYEAQKLRDKHDYESALKQADRALELARENHDSAGEARAHCERAVVLEQLQRVQDAIAEWKKAEPAEPPEPKPSAAMRAILERAEKAGGEALFPAWFQAGKPDYESSLKLAAEALALARDTHDEVGEACAHRDRAIVLGYLTRQDEAIAEWGEAEQGWKRVGYGPACIQSLGTAGQLLLLRKSGEAGKLLDQALRLTQQENRRPLTGAEELTNIGRHITYQGELDWTKKLCQAAFEIQERLAPNSMTEAMSLQCLGGAALLQGNLEAAARYYRRTQVIREVLAPQSHYLAASLNNLGDVARFRGDFNAAGEYYRRALAIYKTVMPNSESIAIDQISLANLAKEQGDLGAAAEYGRLALATEQRLSPLSMIAADCLATLGSVAYERWDLRGATEYYQEALAIQDRLSPQSVFMAGTQIELGNVAVAQGDLRAAAEFYRRALAIYQRLSPDSLPMAESLTGLGVVTEEEGDTKAAAEYFRRALAIQEKLAPDSLSLAGSLESLSAVARDSGDLSSAESLAARAWRIARRQADTVTSDEARQAFGSSTQGYAGTLLSIQVARREPESAFATLEEARAQGLARLLFERRDVLNQASGDLWPRHQEALARLHRAEENVNSAEAQPGGSTEAEEQKQAARRAYQSARDEVDQLWAEIQKRQTHAFAPTLNLADAARALGEGNTFVAFARREDEAYALALRGGEKPRVVAEELQFGPASGRTAAAKREGAKRIDARILGFWNLARTWPDAPGFSQPESAAVITTGKELFTALFPGEIGKLVCESKRLILSPDGPLWQLPFAALVTDVDENGNPHYLGERVALTYAPSLALYVQLRQQAPQLHMGQRPEVLAVGAPDFDRKVELDPNNPQAKRVWAGLYPPGVRPEPLRGTAPEAEVVAQLYGGKPLVSDQATEAEVRRRIEKADVIHLATHGSLQTASPMSSGIMLTPPAKEPALGETDDDGVLQAWEIFSQLKLRAELVVLSACDTARGEVVKGEGVVGLTRALEYAGARSIVATQWSVASGESTTQLMEEFHKGLRNGKAKDEALKEAMAVVRKKYPQPFHWAPFILLGDPDNPNLGKQGLLTSH
jgi:tetratricopeptide (TPR) repeat protein